MNDNLRTELREYSWNYFSIHADQRMSLLRFYLIITSIMLAGYIGLKGETSPTFEVGLLPIVHLFFTHIFWRFDRRTRQLIHNSEEALKILDNYIEDKLEGGLKKELKLFENDDRIQRENERWYNKILFFNSYSTSLNFMYLVIGIGSLALALYEYEIFF